MSGCSCRSGLLRLFPVPPKLRRRLATGSRKGRSRITATGVALGAAVQVLGVVAEVAEAA
jgi:hypothetical protein